MKFESISPIDGTVLWQGEAADNRSIKSVIASAKEVFKDWVKLDLEERKNYIERFVEIVVERKSDLAILLCKETGKVLKECEMEIAGVINKYKISIEAFEDRCKSLEKDTASFKSITRHKPHGVVAVFGPYNFPCHVPNGHIIPALLAGNVVILKPSELTPAISDSYIKCWQDAGLPKNVLQLIQGKSETGIELSKQDDLNGIFFTGSSRVGKILHENYAGKLDKVLALELGGNNPLVLWDYENLDKAVEIIINSAFLSNGQRCTCARRLILADKNADLILGKLIEASSKLKVGNPLEEDTFIGPVISKDQALKLLEAQKSLASKGAVSLLEMKRLALGEAYISPGIIDCTSLKEKVDEEFFGPLLGVYRVSSWQEALYKANDTEYGLSAGLLSDSKDLFDEFFFEIEAGLINWNKQITGASSSAPFGGIKMSGNHNPSAYYAADYCSYPVASLLPT